jgi:LysR family transcriptional regulator, transcriptional activator of nhaA
MLESENNDQFDLLRQINLNHLLYFWAVGKCGSVSAAARRLGVSQPGVTNQVHTLEKRLGATLLERGPRGITLTPAGLVAMRFADGIIGGCSDLVRALPLQEDLEDRPFVVGTIDSVPKVVVRSILKCITRDARRPQVVCREWSRERLLSELSLHRLDAVISDSPLNEADRTGFESYAAATSTVDFYSSPELARKFRRGFPGSVKTAPMLLPSTGTALRASIDRWFAIHELTPQIAVETDDRSLLHNFAEAGLGVLPVATISAPDISRQFGLERIGRIKNVQEAYFVTTLNRPDEHRSLAGLRQALQFADAFRFHQG